MIDVLIVGAGPAGAVAATVLARAGARVSILDRARFPRDKLCGDTVNPGTLALLRALGVSDRVESRGLPIEGMLITGADGVAVESRYPDGVQGRAIVRRELDWSLLQQATSAGASFEPWTRVRSALIDAGRVSGVAVDGGRSLPARVVIAADGRHSTLAFSLGLAAHPARPRRWAIGAYFENVDRMTSLGEMHVRRGGYIGVAPVPGGLTNVCIVRCMQTPDATLRDPEALLRRELARDAALRDRFAAARLVMPPVVLGPLAVDARESAIDGLLLAGDAAGFVDPMTGDGLRVAVQGGELAARAALRALEHGWIGVHRQLARERHDAFATKARFNRTLRHLVGSPAAIRVAGLVASIAPGAVRAVVRHAGDCRLGRAS
jgi:geranylgeranyl reductase family protein